MLEPRPRERRLWIAAAVYLGAIYLSLYPFQLLLDALRAQGLLRVSIVVVFAAAAAAVVALGARARWRPAQWGVAAAGALAVALLASRLPVLQERLHLVEYGALGLLIWAAARATLARRGIEPQRLGRAAVGGAALAAGAAGWLDEGIQGLLPNRVYDLRDVGVNAFAGAFAALLAELHRRSRGARGEAA